MNSSVYNPEFNRRIDKRQIPTCNIMEVEVAGINMHWLLSFTEKNIRDLSGDYMCVANVHTTVTAWEDAHYRSVQNGGIMTIPDGAPLSILGRQRGCSQMDRTTGPTYMEEVFKVSAQRGYRHYFYGSSDETLQKMRRNLEKEYPGLTIAGMYSPPFREVSEEEMNADIARINETNADFVWVGLGAPKQELWMAQHQGKIHGFMVGVGAGFDFFAGNIKRAPRWMQRCSLEWLFRMLQDPGRLFPRYWHTNTRFIYYAVLRRK